MAAGKGRGLAANVLLALFFFLVPPALLELGESTTFGYGVEWRDTYSYLLERQLRDEGRPVQVVNAGVCAWSTRRGC